MPNYTPKFHIGDPGPEELYEYLDTVEARKPTSNPELRSEAAELGHSLGTLEKTTAGAVLGRLGIVQPADQFSYTEMGDALVDVMYSDRELFYNLLHFLYYTAYDRYPEEYVYSSYTYAAFTNYLYKNAPFDSLHGQKGTIVGEVTEQAESDSEIDLSYTSKGVSLSNKSLNNYLQYLERLSPAVNPAQPGESAGFVHRSFCPPGLLLVAVDYLYRQKGLDYNTLLRLTDETKSQLKQICILSEEGFNEVLDYTEQAYSQFSKKHDFGLNLRLDEEVTFHDLE
jgi:hypothetical protein